MNSGFPAYALYFVCLFFNFSFFSRTLHVMKRILNISKNARQAAEWDIQQHISMTPEERQEAARILKERVYGKDCPDVREAEKMKRK